MVTFYPLLSSEDLVTVFVPLYYFRQTDILNPHIGKTWQLIKSINLAKHIQRW